ncbi:hypothetical protein [Streptomyces sp. Root1310]|uniref:hypothetical protein n=1 Tax=Streptomyces sp. Root1310 TaxID=1736452 RepID=UPI00070AFDE5|nr:hypothetical protein [Streptomyces sp. Root1310]KQX67863.1 hypothetical protein ASD48_14695 [Streptomyces sp. Root1310]
MPLVRSYVRSDGTPVRGHSRWAPGARRELTIVAAVGLAVLGFGNAHTADGSAGTRPTPSVTYPIRFDHADSKPRAAVPSPTVSYPIRFDRPTARQAKPGPSVSYPIDLSALGGGR